MEKARGCASLPAGLFVVFKPWSSGCSLQMYKLVLERGEDLVLLGGWWVLGRQVYYSGF